MRVKLQIIKSKKVLVHWSMDKKSIILTTNSTTQSGGIRVKEFMEDHSVELATAAVGVGALGAIAKGGATAQCLTRTLQSKSLGRVTMLACVVGMAWQGYKSVTNQVTTQPAEEDISESGDAPSLVDEEEFFDTEEPPELHSDTTTTPIESRGLPRRPVFPKRKGRNGRRKARRIKKDVMTPLAEKFSEMHISEPSEIEKVQLFSDSFTLPTGESDPIPRDDESTSSTGSQPNNRDVHDSVDESTLNLARALSNLNVYQATSEIYDANLRIDDAFAMIYELKNEIKQLKEECKFLKAYSAVQDKFRFWMRQFPNRELPESVVFDMYGGYCFVARPPGLYVNPSPTKFRRARVRLSREIVGKTVNGLTGETEDIATSTGLLDLA
jgi:UDP-N-acetylglucosamine transferase subunit ALG13